MAEVDLHLHTTASDGRLSPRELVRLLSRRGVRIAAITDHDSTEGLSEALVAKEEFPDLTLIPGIEISTDVPGSEIHILGYFLQWQDEKFQRTLEDLRYGRVQRAKEMVRKLAELNIRVDWERVLEIAGDGAVGRPHVALAMVEKGYIQEPKEAFILYIGRNGPAYVERQKLPPSEGIAFIEEVGGVAVLAHPTHVLNLEEHLRGLKEAGLVGMEVFYAQYTQKTIGHLAEMAAQYELLPCGGSDYHAMGTPGEPLPGDMGPPPQVVEELQARALKGRRPVEGSGAPAVP